MDEFFYFAIGSFLIGLLFLYLSKTAKQTKGRELRVGDKQPKDLRNVGWAMLAFSVVCLTVALLGHFAGRSN